MAEKNKFQYWNNMQVEIIKNYPLFRKYKIKIVYTGRFVIVDKYVITETCEEAVSIAWLEG